FAKWVTSPENPLFARVMVNRVWQHHFGTGLVATPDNFGVSGAKPSHPDLLDFLAAEFVNPAWRAWRAEGCEAPGPWSLKHLRRTQVVTFLQLCAAPAIVSTCGKRAPSTAPLQSLALLNSEFVRARAKGFARRLVREAGDDDGKRLTLAFRLACGRPPLPEE